MREGGRQELKLDFYCQGYLSANFLVVERWQVTDHMQSSIRVHTRTKHTEKPNQMCKATTENNSNILYRVVI